MALSQDDISLFNHFIQRTKCSMGMAKIAGYRLTTSTWNIRGYSGRWMIMPEVVSIEKGHPRRSLCPFSMMLVGRGVYDSIGKWTQVENITRLPKSIVSLGVYGGLTLSENCQRTIMETIEDRERLILGYNIGIHLRNTINGGTPLHFLGCIPLGIVLYGL